MSEFSYIHDLEALSEQERQSYVARLCDYLKIASNLGLIMVGLLPDANGGPSRMVPWIKRAGTEQIRDARKISVVETTHDLIGTDTIMFKVTGKDGNGRTEIGIGAKSFSGIAGDQKDDAIATAHTRACRRMTLQFVGAGVLDESEVAGRIQNAPTGPVSKLTLAEAKPNNVPGKDITITNVPALPAEPVTIVLDKQAEFEAQQKKMREDAIAQLNSKFSEMKTISEVAAETAPVEKKTRRRTKKTIEMGPSEPVPAAAQAVAAAPEAAASVPTPTPVAAPVATVVPPPAQPVATGKPRLTPEQVKPFRQRLFRAVNDYLEPAGFAPKEGIGNADKMRQFANVMFPDVTNMNELTIEQWEKYLSVIEQKIQKEGAAVTVKFLEDSIGL
jgi:hypothetical protein